MAPAHRIRAVALTVSGLVSLGAGWLYMRFIGSDGTNFLDVFRTALFVMTGFWLVWGGTAGVLGALTRMPRQRLDQTPPEAMTAILMPIYNEDAASSFSRVAAMNRSLVALGIAQKLHFAIL